MGGPPQGIRNSIGELERLGIHNEVVCCDAPDAAWLGRDSFPIYTLGPGKYGFAYTPKLGPWLEENLSRFDAVIVHGLWLWPSTCAVRAVAQERALRTRAEAGDLRPEEEEKSRPETGGLRPEVSETSNLSESLNVQLSTLNSKQLRCFVMPHGMLDPWFQRDKSRRVKAVRNWFYWWLIERGVVNSADAMLFTCQQELELARTTFGGYRPKQEINVGYGIAEPPAFEPKMQEAFAARCPGLNGRPYLLFMSRVHPKKNVAALVRAYARIAREHEAWSMEHGATARAESGGLRPEEERKSRVETGGLNQSEAKMAEGKAEDNPGPQPSGFTPQVLDFPDLVIAGPGWESRYGEEVRMLIDEANKALRAGAGGLRAEVGDRRSEPRGTEHRILNTEPRLGEPKMAPRQTAPRQHSACVHAVDMLSGAEKWGALYGCEAFVLPSHQENFGIAVVEALACGKPVLISDQVNIWREIVEDGAGLVEADTEGGVEKLLRRFLDARRGEPDGVVSPPQAERAEGGGLRPEVGGQSSDFSHRLGKIAEDGSERPAADRTGGNAEHRVTSVRGGESSETTDGGPRECYLKRFAIGPAATSLARALKS